MPSPNDAERTVTEQELRTILRRAIELDAKMDSVVTETEVRGIAAQLGVTSSALNQALEEVYAESRELTGLTAKPGVGLPLTLGLFGSLMGIALHITGSDLLFIVNDRPESVLAVLAAQNVAILVALSLKGPGRHWRYQVANAALWLGLSSGWVLMDGDVHPQLPGFMASFAAFAAVFGSAGIVVRDLLRTIGRSTFAKLGRSGGAPSQGRSMGERLARVLQRYLRFFAGDCQRNCRFIRKQLQSAIRLTKSLKLTSLQHGVKQLNVMYRGSGVKELDGLAA